MRERQHKIAIGYLPLVYATVITAILISLFLLIFIGITEKIVLDITTASITETFADRDFFCHEYSISGLKEGHRAEVAFTAKKRYVGTALNTAEVTVYDKNGKDITYKYTTDCHFGAIKVLPAEYRIITGSAKGEYNGKDISNDEFEISGLLEGHSVSVVSKTVLKDAGKVPNVFKIKITDKDNRDITKQYVAVPDYGTLEVLPRKITISSESVTVKFTNEPFIPKNFTIESGTLADNDRLTIRFPKEYIMKGIYDNYFIPTVYSENNGDTVNVTRNYIIEEKIGKLIIE